MITGEPSPKFHVHFTRDAPPLTVDESVNVSGLPVQRGTLIPNLASGSWVRFIVSVATSDKQPTSVINDNVALYDPGVAYV